MSPRGGTTTAAVRIALVLACVATTLSAAPADAVDPPRGVQFSGPLTFVNKDVDGQRFAITREEEDGTVTGNVFFEDCRRPKFIVCAPTGTDQELSCAVATACEAQPCGFADAFVTDVTLPADFFQVPAEAPDDGGDTPGEAASCPTSSRAIQESDDDERIFVNKDVDGQRYAITKFTADDTVTGNVFVGPDVPPKFIVCAPLGDPAERRFQCDVSDPCPPSPAPCTFGGFSAEVTLPEGFFDLDETVTQTVNAFGATDALTDALRLGVSAIPTGTAAHTRPAGPERTVQVDAQVTECPGGGTIAVDGVTIEFEQCRVASMVCSGNGALANGAFTATLTCTDLDRDRTFELTAALQIASTDSGDAMNGSVRTEQSTGTGFGMDYEGVSVTPSSLGGGQFGLTRVSNVPTYFPGTFSDFEFPFDGSAIVIVTAFIPSPPGFIEQQFELNLVTGQLTPLE